MAWLEDPTPIFDSCSEDPRNFSRLARAQFGAWEVFQHQAFGACTKQCTNCIKQCTSHITCHVMHFVPVSNSAPARAPYCTPSHAFGVYPTLQPRWGIGVKCRLKQMVRQPPLRQGLGVPARPEIVEVS